MFGMDWATTGGIVTVLALVLFDVLGWWNTMSQAELVWIVVVVWAAQLALSPVWLARFRFGPVEWVWRSLTYRRLQPVRVRGSGGGSGPGGREGADLRPAGARPAGVWHTPGCARG